VAIFQALFQGKISTDRGCGHGLGLEAKPGRVGGR
jgi:hypothetical protein